MYSEWFSDEFRTREVKPTVRGKGERGLNEYYSNITAVVERK